MIDSLFLLVDIVAMVVLMHWAATDVEKDQDDKEEKS